jgi:repressor LexA
MNLCHTSSNIRISDSLQAGFYPDFKGALRSLVRHNPDMDFSFDIERVRAAMKDRGVSQADVAAAAGLTSQSAVSNILKGIRHVRVDEARKIYSYLELNPAGASPVKTIPIIGLTNAGSWREAVEMSIGSMSIPRAIGSDKAFAIEVSGDSMNRLIEEGGYVVVDPMQTQLFDGRTYLIENSDYETTVKRYLANPARFAPMSTNPEHQDIMLGDGHYRVIGRVVWKGGMVD